MSMMNKLIQTNENSTITFGDYELKEKSKLDNYEFAGDIYKIKTFCEMTKLEKNGLLVYESVPGTKVSSFAETENGAEFEVECPEDAQLTLGMEPDTAYKVIIADTLIGEMKTNLGGKLNISVSMSESDKVKVQIMKA